MYIGYKHKNIEWLVFVSGGIKTTVSAQCGPCSEQVRSASG